METCVRSMRRGGLVRLGVYGEVFTPTLLEVHRGEQMLESKRTAGEEKNKPTKERSASQRAK